MAKRIANVKLVAKLTDAPAMSCGPSERSKLNPGKAGGLNNASRACDIDRHRPPQPGFGGRNNAAKCRPERVLGRTVRIAFELRQPFWASASMLGSASASMLAPRR